MNNDLETQVNKKSDSLKHILLVDDEPNVLRALERLLRNQKLVVYTANNAAEAMIQLAQNPIQVMLTDHKMPETTGAQLIDQVRAKHPNIVSIMLSGEADFEQVIRLLNEKAAMRFIKKPWNNAEIVETIEQAFKHYNKSTFGTWQQRINRLTKTSLNTDFEMALGHLDLNESERFVAALQYLNIAELATVSGQERCELIQAELVDEARKLLPDMAELFHYEAGLLLILLPATHNEVQIRSMIEHVMQTIQQKVSNEVSSLRLEVRAAFQCLNNKDVSAELLIEQLKSSIQSTDALKPLIQIDIELQNKLIRQQQIRGSLATELDSGQFKLVIQPKVTLENKVIESAEVLLRWQHSTLGWISPLEFIRLAELDGQINRMGDWVLENGIKLISRLTRFSPDMKSVSINVSARQLYQLDFAEKLKAMLEKYSVDPLFLELEITETCISEDPKYIQNVLWQLKLLGVSISVDDFGSGGTAFGFLTYLPIDTLKLDKGLIDGLAFSSSQRKLVKSLIDVCHSLSIEVVAEGAEDEKTVEILEELHCDKVQGFIFSKALPLPKFEELLIKQPFMRN